MNPNENNSSGGEGVSSIAMKTVIGFLLVLTVILAIWASYNHVQINRYRLTLQNTYLRAADLASENLSNLSSDLVKGMYAGTSPQLSMISSKMWQESSAAKSALSTLPVTDAVMENTNRFLSQAGDYAMYLSRKFASGQELTDEERQQFASLREYADRLSEQVDAIATALQNGNVSIEQLALLNHQGSTANQQNDTSSQQDNANAADSSTMDAPATAGSSVLKQVEDGFTGYPTLIYDGPFSDHILEKTPLMTKDKPEITEEQARTTAKKACPRELPEVREENSKLPCYVFHDGVSNSVAITKNGGYLCYFVTEKPDAIAENLSYEDAISKAQQYLASIGYQSMKDTYYEIDNGVVTINFAYYDASAQTICYTDLIKVAVSMQDGSILGLDARGYLVNHQQRSLDAPAITMEQAQESVSKALTIDSSRLALIPTSGQNEVSAYEFLCTSSTGDRVLSYINTQTGAEEQLLILLETPNGTLTK